MRKKKKEKGGSEEAGRKPEFLHTRARPTRHPSISFDAHFAYAQHAFSPRHLSPLFSSILLSSLSLSRASRNSLSFSLSLFLSSWRIIMVTILGMRGKQAVIFHRNELFSGIFLPSVVLLWLPRRDKMGREFFGPRDAKHGFDRAQAARRY